MDLRGLMGSREAPGPSRGAGGGGRKEAMKKGYKQPGSVTGTTSAEARSLRTIQVKNMHSILKGDIDF